MKTKYTPGPWTESSPYTLEISGRLVPVTQIVGDGNDLQIAIIPQSPQNEQVAKEIEANTKLITSAPDLLEACKRGLACALSLDDEQSVKDAEMLRAAIAKAEGK